MEPDQKELFNAETTWFHLFRTMFIHGDAAKMGPAAFSCYCAIKAHTSFSTGESFPGHPRIAELTGISESTIKRHLGKLTELGYVIVTRKGRKNYYKLREKVAIQDAHGRPSAVATWDYLPASVQAAVADLKNILVTGEVGNAKIVHIQHITVNVNNGAGTQINVDMSKADAGTKAEIKAMLKAAAGNGNNVTLSDDGTEEF